MRREGLQKNKQSEGKLLQEGSNRKEKQIERKRTKEGRNPLSRETRAYI